MLECGKQYRKKNMYEEDKQKKNKHVKEYKKIIRQCIEENRRKQ